MASSCFLAVLYSLAVAVRFFFSSSLFSRRRRHGRASFAAVVLPPPSLLQSYRVHHHLRRHLPPLMRPFFCRHGRRSAIAAGAIAGVPPARVASRPQATSGHAAVTLWFASPPRRSTTAPIATDESSPAGNQASPASSVFNSRPGTSSSNSRFVRGFSVNRRLM